MSFTHTSENSLIISCGVCGGDTKETYLEILYFKQFYKYFVFVEDGEGIGIRGWKVNIYTARIYIYI